MITLHDRRAYWERINGVQFDLQSIDGVVSVPEGQVVTQAELEAIPDFKIRMGLVGGIPTGGWSSLTKLGKQVLHFINPMNPF